MLLAMQGQVNHVQLGQLLSCVEVAIEDVIDAADCAPLGL